MSSKSDFQEFQFTELSDSRKKVDFQLIENPQHMENAPNMLYHRERDSLQSESMCDLRKSLAWDSAFFTSPGVLDPEELFETLNFQVMDNGADISGPKEPKPLLSESIVTARTNGIDSLRKSLAWDSAFFTSAGVLDAEELSILNRGFKKPEGLMFPGLDEEIWRSAESNSTITSDGYSLASLEIDLFDDIRASINKSLDVSSNGMTSTCKLKRENGLRNVRASKISGVSSRAGADQKKNAAASGESKPLLSIKPPKISGRASHSPIAPSKRASLSTNHARMDNKATKSASGKSISTSKKMCLRESCSTVSSLKSPSSVLPAATNEFAGICYTSADFTGKSNLLRRTTDSFSSTSGSSFRTPLKYSVGNKTELVNSSDPICLLSTPKSTDYTSPAGSIDGWSSDSSSTAVKQRSCSSAASLVNTPSRERSFHSNASKVSDSERHHYGQLCLGHEETKFRNPQINNMATCTSPTRVNLSTKLTPSGLRMPSPKIGFFDTENSAGIAQNGGLKFQFGSQGTSSKNGSGISNANGYANRTTRYGKHRLAGTSTGLVNKTGMKDEGKVCLREKKQPLKEHGVLRLQFPENNVHSLGEYNKENISSLANQVDDLSRRMGGINFSCIQRK